MTALPQPLAPADGAVLSVASLLHANGQSTDRTAVVAAQLGTALASRTILVAGWDGLSLAGGQPGSAVAFAVAAPVSVNMRRVVSAMQLAADVGAGRCPGTDIPGRAALIRLQPANGTWVFAAGCALGSGGLAVIFGAEHWLTVALCAANGAAGGVLRRGVEAVGGNGIVQSAMAALAAGLGGSLAIRAGLPSSLHLIAVCPCMILVPGPHILNGAFDLLSMRVPLGAARLAFAAVTLLAISIGLLAGLAVGGAALPEAGASLPVAFWLDVPAAGAAALAYSIFFSTPYRMLAWPIGLGMAAHAIRWLALSELHANVVVAVLAASMLVGAIVAPLAHHLHLPFAAVGFACVVSQLPGVYVFRTVSGLAQVLQQGEVVPPALVASILTNATTTMAIVLAIAVGLAVPRALYNLVQAHRSKPA